MLIHPLISLVRVVGVVVGLIALVAMGVVGVVVGLITPWVEGTSTDVVDGVTDGHTSSISCTTVPAVRQICFFNNYYFVLKIIAQLLLVIKMHDL